jgi:hypothetical protein
MNLTEPANYSKSQVSKMVMHFHLLNCPNTVLPSIFLTSNLYLENAWVVAQVHGIVSGKTALPVISLAAHDVYQGGD